MNAGLPAYATSTSIKLFCETCGRAFQVLMNASSAAFTVVSESFRAAAYWNILRAKH